MPVRVSNACIKRQCGISLIEAVVTIVVIGIALAAISSGMDQSLRRSADPLWQARAAQLAQSYIDDGMALRFQEDTPPGGGAVATCSSNGPETGEATRAAYDDIDDYDGLSESGQFLDTVASASSQYQVQVSVACSDAIGTASISSKRMLVTVTGPDSRVLRLSALRGNY